MVMTAPVETVETPVEVPVKPLEVNTPLKVSEALRLGAMDTKQVFGKIGDLESTTCALGAVYHGFGFEGYGAAMQSLNREMARVIIPCGGTTGLFGKPCRSENTLMNVVIHMNDQHKMPREKIADYIESLGF